MSRAIQLGYSFNPAAQTVTFNTVQQIQPEYLFFILDVTKNTMIYQANVSGQGGTFSGNTLTLAFNTTTGGYASTDVLQIAYEAPSYVSNIAQESGGNLANLNAAVQGATTTDAPLSVSIAGDPNGDFAGVNLLEQVMQDGTGLAINTKTLNPVKVDSNNATVLTDCPTAIVFSGNNSSYIFDTQGYQQLSIETTATTLTVQGSNSQSNWYSLPIVTPAQGMQMSGNVYAAGLYNVLCISRYIRVTHNTVGTSTCYLRQLPTQPFAQVNANASGVTAIGGPTNVGVAPTAYPVQMSGVDSAGLTRRNLLDTAGATQIGGWDGNLQTHRLLTDVWGAVQVTQTPATQQNASVPELLAQISKQLQTISHYLYDMPQMIALANGNTNAQQPRSSGDEPDSLLAEWANNVGAVTNLQL